MWFGTTDGISVFDGQAFKDYSTTYTYIAPVSWYTIGHVTKGRAELNFSEWGRYGLRKKDTRLKAICDQCQRGEMPIPSYALVHPGVRLSPDEVKRICEWTAEERNRLPAEHR